MLSFDFAFFQFLFQNVNRAGRVCFPQTNNYDIDNYLSPVKRIYKD